MVVTIESKVIINGKFHATGPRIGEQTYGGGGGGHIVLILGVNFFFNTFDR